VALGSRQANADGHHETYLDRPGVGWRVEYAIDDDYKHRLTAAINGQRLFVCRLQRLPL
jgi:hypothetical protein